MCSRDIVDKFSGAGQVSKKEKREENMALWRCFRLFHKGKTGSKDNTDEYRLYGGGHHDLQDFR